MSNIVEDFTPRYVGDLSRPLQIFFTDHEGNVDNITGASGVAMKIRNRNTGISQTGTGTFSITNAAQGQAIYYWSSGDMSVAGIFDFQVSATMSDGTAHWDTRTIEIRQPL